MMETANRDAEIVEHYRRYFGQESRTVRFGDRPEPAPQSVSVLEFAPLAEEADWVYATVGASHGPQPGVSNEKSHYEAEARVEGRIELVLLCREQHDDLIDLLETLAAYPLLTGAHFGPGHTVAGSKDEGVVQGSPLTEILLGYPHFEPPEFEVVRHLDGSHTHILWVVPIYMSERIFIRENGYIAFEKLLADRQADTSDLWREPAV